MQAFSGQGQACASSLGNPPVTFVRGLCQPKWTGGVHVITSKLCSRFGVRRGGKRGPLHDLRKRFIGSQ